MNCKIKLHFLVFLLFYNILHFKSSNVFVNYKRKYFRFYFRKYFRVENCLKLEYVVKFDALFHFFFITNFM